MQHRRGMGWFYPYRLRWYCEERINGSQERYEPIRFSDKGDKTRPQSKGAILTAEGQRDETGLCLCHRKVAMHSSFRHVDPKLRAQRL